MRNEPHLSAKRAAVQRLRKRSDAEIFERFPLHFVPTYPGDETLMNSALFHAMRPNVSSVERTLAEIMKS